LPGHIEEEKNVLPLPYIETRFLGCAAVRVVAEVLKIVNKLVKN
jgi:hypothetical protein